MISYRLLTTFLGPKILLELNRFLDACLFRMQYIITFNLSTWAVTIYKDEVTLIKVLALLVWV